MNEKKVFIEGWSGDLIDKERKSLGRKGWFEDFLVKGKGRFWFWDRVVWCESVMYGFFEKGVILLFIRFDEWFMELYFYLFGLCILFFLGGWLFILDFFIFKKILGLIWFSIKVIFFFFFYIWVCVVFLWYCYD